MHLGYLWMPEKKALGRTVHVCVFVCLFSMGFPLLCPSLKAPFSLICCVSCPLCLPLFSSAHPITAQWLIACLASKSQCVSLCVCVENSKTVTVTEELEAVCVFGMWTRMTVWVVGFVHVASDPECSWLHSNHWHTLGCNWEAPPPYTHTFKVDLYLHS